MTDQHPPLPCTVCKAPRPFIEYRTKMGKDGKMAKWPHYGPCPNLADPVLHPHRHTNGIKSGSTTSPEPHTVAQDRISLSIGKDTIGRLYSMTSYSVQDFVTCLTQYREAEQREPAGVLYSDKDEQLLAEAGLFKAFADRNLPADPSKLTGNYGYIILSHKKEPKNV